MKISIMETSFPEADRPAALVMAAGAGAHGVELVLADPRAVSLHTEPEHLGQLREHLLEAGLVASSVALVAHCETDGLVHRSDATPAAMDMVRRAIDLTAAVGGGVLLLPCFRKAAITGEAELNTLGEQLIELGEQADEAGVTIGVESMLSTQDKIFLHDHTGGVGVSNYLDVGNTALRKLDPATEIRDLGPERICMVHFKDVKVREGQPAEMKLRLGEGQVPFESVAQSLKAIGYDGWITLETPPLDDSAGVAKANVDYARHLLGL